MSRMIDADALISDLEYDVKMDEDSLIYEDLTSENREIIQFDKDCKQNAIDLLNHAPTVEERKTGYWIEDKEASKGHIEKIYRCSACNNFEAWGETELYKFCPICGFRMLGVKHETDRC